MKNQVFIIGICAALSGACNSDGSKSVQDTTPALSQTNNENRSMTDTLGADQPDDNSPNFSRGKELIAQSDCLTCHKEQDKLIGPSYAEVAAKYEETEANVKLLADKIISGGQGVWGQVPMTPHPNVSEEQAEEMVRYILSLN